MSDTTAASPWHDLDAYIATPRLTGLTLSPDGASLVVSVQGPDADVTGYTTALWRVDWTSVDKMTDSWEMLLQHPDGSHNLPPALRAETTAQYLHLLRMADGNPLSPLPRPAPIALGPDLPACGRTVAFAGLRFTLTAADPAQPPPDGLRTVEVPLAALPGLQLRLPESGDRIHPFGAHGGKPLRRYLTDRKLDRPFRPWLPLLCAGSEVLWAVGLGAAEDTRRTAAPAVRLSAEGLLPWADAPA